MSQRKKFLAIGQAKGDKWKSGAMYVSKLWDWFAMIGMTREDVYKVFEFDAMIPHGTPRAKKGRVPPSGEQMAAYHPTLIKNIDALNPKLVVPIGGIAVQRTLATKAELSELIGHRFVMKPFNEAKRETVVIPLPHPSGVSLWLNAQANKKLLAQAMQLIREEIAK